ncbi:hypothetical protein [Lentzea fradiae]|uniref:hypothetical protein n=1 Tax=Lentzea fradiae TaxID=200378 RepID=UPI00115FAB64|nr:hypothetical protein [Lentzea fradiae]
MVEVEEMPHQVLGRRAVDSCAFAVRQAVIDEYRPAADLSDAETRRGVGKLAQKIHLSIEVCCLLPRHPHPDTIAHAFE